LGKAPNMASQSGLVVHGYHKAGGKLREFLLVEVNGSLTRNLRNS
jgi:hypothetical protein